MKDGYFAHFYNGPTEVMENIPSHVIFMIDTALSERYSLYCMWILSKI